MKKVLSLIVLMTLGFIFQHKIILYSSLLYYKIIGTDKVLSKIDKVFIINLDRSTDRYQNMQKQLKQISFPLQYTKFKATDGLEISFTNKMNNQVVLVDEVKNGYKVLDGNYSVDCGDKVSLDAKFDHQTNFRKRELGEFGVSCSHKRVWKAIIDNGYENTLVMEDDNLFKTFSKERLAIISSDMPDNYDILFADVSYLKSSIDPDFKNIHLMKLAKDIAYTNMYIISRKGAKVLYENSKSYESLNHQNLPIDLLMGELIELKMIHAYAPYLKVAKQNGESVIG